MIISLLLVLLGWFVILYVSINLVGLLVRGLFKNPDLENLKIEGHDFIKSEIKKVERADKWLNIIAFVLIIIYFYILVHFWNYGVAMVAGIIMSTRLPDLLWEIKHGRKLEPKILSKNFLYFADIVLTILTLPLLYYFLFAW